MTIKAAWLSAVDSSGYALVEIWIGAGLESTRLECCGAPVLFGFGRRGMWSDLGVREWDKGRSAETRGTEAWANSL